MARSNQEVVLGMFNTMPVEELFRLYCCRFGWFSDSQKALLRKGIIFGQSCDPTINEYFWRHLPRTVLSISIFDNWLKTQGSGEGPLKVMDIGAYQPIAAFWAKCAQESNREVFYSYVTTGGDRFCQDSEYGLFSAESSVAEIGRTPLPFSCGEFDFVIMTEVIEHIDRHPQYVLKEISRVMNNNGCLLLTTPNMTS